MKIDVKIGEIRENSTLRAYATATLDDSFVITGIRVLNGKHGNFVAMPSYKNAKGDYVEYCHPITKEFKKELDQEILDAFSQKQLDDLSEEELPDWLQGQSM
ncbi:MAG: SpoVG family protein [Clostridia bacterium]